ncbi:uncharacterized protein LOC100183776 [Ciona intestinalis]
MEVDTIVYIILEVLLGVLSIFGNALVCYVVLHSRTLRKKVMYMFVTSLAVADICVGAIAIPFAILTKLGLPSSSPFLCVSMLSFIMIPTQISIFNLMAISVERYLSIRHPRIHYNKLTVDKSLTVVVLTWIVSVVIGMLPLFGWNRISNPPGNRFNETLIIQRLSIMLQSRTTNSTPTVIPSPKPALDQCEFMQVMDFDYMFFNFAACVLPPLITSAILYFIIFVSVLRVQEKSQQSTLVQAGTSASPTFSNRSFSTTPVFRRHQMTKPRANSKTGNWLQYQETQKHVDIPTQSIMQKHSKESKSATDAKDQLKRNAKEIQLQVESPSSSAVFQNLHEPENELPANNVAEQHLALDKHLLSDRLNRIALDENHLNKPRSLSCKYEPKSGTCCSKLTDSTVSTYSSTPCRSRTGTNDFQVAKKRSHNERHIRRVREMRAAVVLALIVLSFAICWMPIHILNTIHRFDPSRVIPAYVYNVAILLSHCNSTVNFFLYSWRLKAFRIHLHKRVLNKLRRND